MERNYMDPHLIVDFEYIEEQSAALHEHENPEILFVLEGTLEVKTDQQSCTLHSEDFLLINAGRRHSYHSDRRILAVRFQIALSKLQEMLHRKTIIFHCSSLFDKAGAQKEMRKLLKDILFCNVNAGTKDDFYVSSLHFQLLSLLCSRFLLDYREPDGGISEEKDRMQQIMDYIRANYRNPILLQDVADELFLSPTYLSKYVRKNCGKSFVELINDIRLSHAMEDLIYTDSPVIKIAMDNGFASVAALNKVFKEAYHTTPSVYRKEKQSQGQNHYLAEQTALYLHRHLEEGKQEENTSFESSLLLKQADARPMKLHQIMNVGHASDLAKASVQSQILFCKEHLGIRYIRFWNVFEEDMFIDQRRNGEKMNYGRLYGILDFLVENDLVPYMELRVKPRKILRTANQTLHAWNHPEDLKDLKEKAAFFDDFFGHLIRRYGQGGVKKWMFNYPVASDIHTAKQDFDDHIQDSDLQEAYLDEFDTVASAFRARFPEGQIGGGGFPARHLGQERMEQFFRQWEMHAQLPDFISITSFPYQLVQEDDLWYEQRRTDPGFVKTDVDMVRAAMSTCSFASLPLHLAECNLTLSDRAYINDTLMRGAFFANTIIRNYEQVDYFGIWNALDSYSDFADSYHYLFGGSGFLTKTGVPKPAGHILYFLNRLYSEHIVSRDDTLISFNEHGHYKILVHHLVNMNTAYYLKDEHELTALGIEKMTETAAPKRIHVRIEGVENETWQIRRYCLNTHAGSILNEWLDLNIDFELQRNETRYLERVCVPKLLIQKINAINDVLEFDIELEPNEVQYLHITEYT